MKRLLVLFAALVAASAVRAQISPNQNLVWTPPDSGVMSWSSPDEAEQNAKIVKANLNVSTGGAQYTRAGRNYARGPWTSPDGIFGSNPSPLPGFSQFEELLIVRQTHEVDENNNILELGSQRNVFSTQYYSGFISGGNWNWTSSPKAPLLKAIYASIKNSRSGGKATSFEIQELGKYKVILWCAQYPSDFTKVIGEFEITLDEAWLIGQQGIGDWGPGGSGSGDVGPGGGSGGGLDEESKGWLGSINDFITNFWTNLLAFFIPSSEDMSVMHDAFNTSKLGSWFNFFFDLIEEHKAYLQTNQQPYAYTFDIPVYDIFHNVTVDFSFFAPGIILARTLFAAWLIWQTFMLCRGALSQAFSLYGQEPTTNEGA